MWTKTEIISSVLASLLVGGILYAKNMRSWVRPLIEYDLDGDGRKELIVKDEDKLRTCMGYYESHKILKRSGREYQVRGICETLTEVPKDPYGLDEKVEIGQLDDKPGIDLRITRTTKNSAVVYDSLFSNVHPGPRGY